MPKCRPSGWKGKKETFEKINKALKEWESGKCTWFIKKFKYDGWKDPKKRSATDKKDKEKKRKELKTKSTDLKSDLDSESDLMITLGLMTYSSFQTQTV